MIYKFDDKIFNVEIIRKNNKNTYIKLKNSDTIYVTTGLLVSNHYIKKLLDENHHFLEKSLNKIKMKENFENKFMLLGNEYDVVFISNLGNVKIDSWKKILYASDQLMLDKWLNIKLKTLILNRLNYNYNLFDENIPYPKLKIRNMKTRWGVCNRANNTITINSKLIKYSLEKLDYVIIHELSHFVEFNHSKSFWKVVSKYCPNYKIIRKKLNGQ